MGSLDPNCNASGPHCASCTLPKGHAGRHESRQCWDDVPSGTEVEIYCECRALASMLVSKNRAYGDSALDPVRLFSRADAVEQLKVRIDDKLSRLVRGEAAGEDVVKDLLGYLILLRVAQNRAKAGAK